MIYIRYIVKAIEKLQLPFTEVERLLVVRGKHGSENAPVPSLPPSPLHAALLDLKLKGAKNSQYSHLIVQGGRTVELPTIVSYTGLAAVRTNEPSISSDAYKPPPTIPTPTVVLEVSDVPQDPRLLKLKSELMSIYYMVPESLFLWDIYTSYTTSNTTSSSTNQQPLTSSTILNLDLNTTSNTPTTTTPTTAPSVISESNNKAHLDLTSLLTSYTSKNYPSLSKLMHTEILACYTVKDIFKLIFLLECLLPQGIWSCLYKSKHLKSTAWVYELLAPDSPPTSTTTSTSATTGNTTYTYMTISYLAQHIYALDRSLHYEEFSDKDNNISLANRNYYPHIQYTPKCCTSSSCIRGFFHDGKCQYTSDTASRMHDIHEKVLIQQQPSTTNTNTATRYSANHSSTNRTATTNTRTSYNPNPSYQPNPSNLQYASHTRILAILKEDPSEFDLDVMMPYNPPVSEFKTTVWV